VSGCLLRNALLCSAGSREEEKLPIGENTVHVKKKKFDLSGARLAVWHEADFSRALFWTDLTSRQPVW
jgi:hypothetical protein